MSADEEDFGWHRDKTKTNSNELFYQAVLLGDYGIGKSSVFFKFKTGEYTDVLDDHAFDMQDRVYERGDKKITVSGNIFF